MKWAGYEEAINLPNLGSFLSPTQACGLMEQGLLKAGNSFVGMSSGRSGTAQQSVGGVRTVHWQ